VTSTENELTAIEREIARANPVPAASLPPSDSPYARQLLSEIQATSVPALRIHGRVGRRGVAVAAAVTTIAVIAAAVASQLLPSPSAGNRAARNPRAVTDALTALAAAAAARPATRPPGPGQYQYTRSVSGGLGQYGNQRHSFRASFLLERQIWIGWNGSGRIAETMLYMHLLTAHDRAEWVAAGRCCLSSGPSDQRFGPHGLTLAPVNEWKLPTDPAQLGAMLRTREIESGPPGPREDFVQVGDLLRETDAPPALRAALFKAAASIPGVRLLGRITDRFGRTGIVIAEVAPLSPGRYQLNELIFAPKTSALLDEQIVLVNTRTHTRTVMYWNAYIASGVVGSVTKVAPPYSGTVIRSKTVPPSGE
jgi:hypothetical protein